MKTRNGFVSNSSSSSFVIIDQDELIKVKTEVFNVGKSGETEFGWGPEDIEDYNSRINFAYLQCMYSKNRLELTEMLSKVIRKHTGAKNVVYHIAYGDWQYERDDDKVNGYIDHQSSAEEGMNMEIFNSEYKLKCFLFGKGSKICLRNDNGDWNED